MQEFDNEINKTFKFDFSAPLKSRVRIQKLKNFLIKDPSPVLVFYGGEPLLEYKKIIKIIDAFKDTKIKFKMQTNGKLLNKLPAKYLSKIDKILVSLDGDKERTDKNKGAGTYDLVTKNLALARSQGYKGEIVARMVIAQDSPDLCEQATHLLSLNLFDSIHWQIDAGFYKFDYNKDKFAKFVKEYNQSLSKLLNIWMQEIQKGKVVKLYPFLQITQDLLTDQKATCLRCGAGHFGYAISTDGQIYACPIAQDILNFKAGDLTSEPEKLTKFDVSYECSSCDIKDLCGGRCLYWNYARLWPPEGNKQICSTIRHLITSLQAALPRIKELIKNKTIKLEDFNHERYFGPEIIP